MRFGFREKPMLWASVFLALLTSLLDIASMSLLYPITLLVQKTPIDHLGFISKYLSPRFLEIKFLLIFFLLLVGLRLLSSLTNQAIYLKNGKSLLAVMGSRLFSKVIAELPIAEVNEKGIGHFASLAGDEAFRASTMIINLSQFLNLGCITLMYYISIIFFSMKAFIFITVFLSVCFLLMMTVFKKIHSLGRQQTMLSREAGLVFIDSLNNIKSVRCYNSEKVVTNNYFKKLSEYTDVLFWVDFYQAFLKTIPILFLIAFTVVFLQISMVKNQELDIAFVVALIAYLSRFFPSLGLCLNTLLKLISDAKSGKDIIQYLDGRYQLIVTSEGTFQFDEPIENIKLNHIDFKFGEKTILKDFNYEFTKGSVYTIFGPSGIGKSTLLDIILKFYESEFGEVIINKIPLATIKDSSIRKKIVLMEQRVTIFNDTILNNISLGADHSKEQIVAACKLAKIDGFIEALPEKYNTIVQYMGANLSGGQRQRIALARALLRNPDVLILDESLSALDTENKKQIFSELKSIFKNKILISISHDPWIIENSDVVLDFQKMQSEY